jgi:hypothetical protein
VEHHAAIHTQNILVSKAHNPSSKPYPEKDHGADLKKPETGIFVVDDLITLASCMCEPFAIFDRHIATGICDQSSLLQHACRHSDRGAARTQHHGQEFVRYGQMIALHSVMAHHQPPSETLW